MSKCLITSTSLKTFGVGLKLKPNLNFNQLGLTWKPNDGGS